MGEETNQKPVEAVVRPQAKPEPEPIGETNEQTTQPAAVPETVAANPENATVPPAADQANKLSRRVVDVSEMQRKQPKPKQDDFVATTVEQASMEDFEALLNETGADPIAIQFEIGDKIEGHIDQIGEKWVYVSFGPNEGLADIHEFTNKEGELTLELGKTYTFFVTSRKDGTVFLGQRLNTKEATLQAVEISFQSGMPIEGRVTGRNKGGFEIEISGVRGFCPVSQIELAYCDDPDVHLGQSYHFKVIEFGENGRKVVLSRAALLKEKAQALAKELLKTLAEGAELDGTVTRVTDFGAFVDIGGAEGLVHRSEMGWGHFDHPSEVLAKGEVVRVTVQSIEESEKGPRISLSMKALMADPWEKAVAEYPEGARFTGKVTRCEVFGAFVELVPGVEGLVHISELGWDDRVRKASDVVQPGQLVAVQVLSIDVSRRRIGLSMKVAADDPWAEISTRFQLGMEVKGTVERIQDFGAFIRLGDQVTALLPRSEMNLTRESTPFREYHEGQEVTAIVLSIDPGKRRMALTVRESEVAQGPSSYSDPGSGGLGTFGDLLKKKLEDG